MDHLAVHLFAVAVVGVAALSRVAEPRVEVVVRAADGGSLVAVVGLGKGGLSVNTCIRIIKDGIL